MPPVIKSLILGDGIFPVDEGSTETDLSEWPRISRGAALGLDTSGVHVELDFLVLVDIRRRHVK